LNPRPSPCQELAANFWEKYKHYLSGLSNRETTNDRIAYARKYYHVLLSGNASNLLSLSTDKRIHAMKSLAALSKYLGCYDSWTNIRHNYQLKWSNGDSLDIFNKIFADKENYSSMMGWVKNAIKLLPKPDSNILIFCTLTGLRAHESFKSVELIHNDRISYLNNNLMILEHFRYPNIFFRRTKKAYISIVNKKILNSHMLPYIRTAYLIKIKSKYLNYLSLPIICQTVTVAPHFPQ
jgi:hypothetical protein